MNLCKWEGINNNKMIIRGWQRCLVLPEDHKEKQSTMCIEMWTKNISELCSLNTKPGYANTIWWVFSTGRISWKNCQIHQTKLDLLIS